MKADVDKNKVMIFLSASLENDRVKTECMSEYKIWFGEMSMETII